MVVPDKAMDDFRKVTDLSAENLAGTNRLAVL